MPLMSKAVATKIESMGLISNKPRKGSSNSMGRRPI